MELSYSRKSTFQTRKSSSNLINKINSSKLILINMRIKIKIKKTKMLKKKIKSKRVKIRILKKVMMTIKSITMKHIMRMHLKITRINIKLITSLIKRFSRFSTL